MNQILISDIVKEYPHMFKVVIYHESYRLSSGSGVTKKQKREHKAEENIQRSVRRSRTTIQDIILCNDFELWCTFTFDKRKVDRTDISRCRSVMSTWLFNQRTHSPNLKYLIVPELHKDGALHFHALLSNFHGPLKDSKHKTKKGQTIYNATGYRSGFTEFIKLDSNKEAISKYITKQYMTKNMPLFPGKKRFWTSQNLTRPETFINGLSKFNLKNIVKNQKPDYINESYEVQYHKKLSTLTSNRQTSLLPDFF